MEKTDDAATPEGVGEEKAKPTEPEEVSPVDAKKATQLAIEYLESLYGNLSMLLFRLEDVRMNGTSDRYLVLCSLLTNVGGPRRYYFLKIDVTNGTLLKVSKGFRNIETETIDWKEENLPPGEE